MKRRWSHPSCALPLLIVVFLLLTFLCCLRRCATGPTLSPAAPAAGRGSYDDATFMELAAVDPAATAVLRAAEGLLEGNMSRSPPEHRDAVVRGLRDWLGKQRRFEPGVMSELVDLIKRPIDRYAGSNRDEDGRQQQYASCAVVGNSGVLLAREHGALIDGHDLVVRLNNAPVGAKGTRLARHVGARTGLAFLNSNVLSRSRSGDPVWGSHP
jgi:beta-1,6-galactosyltransferase